jgi:hypothetical protein
VEFISATDELINEDDIGHLKNLASLYRIDKVQQHLLISSDRDTMGFGYRLYPA